MMHWMCVETFGACPERSTYSCEVEGSSRAVEERLISQIVSESLAEAGSKRPAKTQATPTAFRWFGDAMGTLVQLNISNGGMPKQPIGEARVSVEGVAGDWQKNRKYHGGPDQAICLFSVEQYDWLRDEHGIDIAPGSVGENFTTRGIDLQIVKPGDCLRVGECLIEITMVRTPCRNLDQFDKRLMKAMVGRSGWKARVIEEGIVRAGDAIEHQPSGESSHG